MRGAKKVAKKAVFKTPAKKAVFKTPTKKAVYKSPAKKAVLKKVPSCCSKTCACEARRYLGTTFASRLCLARADHRDPALARSFAAAFRKAVSRTPSVGQ